eukprot:140068-Chlamydomonas_euryale.AAC.9
MARCERVLRAECGAKRVDVGQCARVELALQLARHCQVCAAAEKVLRVVRASAVGKLLDAADPATALLSCL